jgi:hypothetical protein
VAGCQDPRWSDALHPSLTPTGQLIVQEGELTLQDGEDAEVVYRKPFQSPPRLTIAELRQSRFGEQPYSKADFPIVRQGATSFKVRNAHGEVGRGSWATLKWHAEGTLAGGAATARSGPVTPEPRSEQERAIARVKAAGGSVTTDSSHPGSPVVGIDLHRTRITDADLEQLQGLTQLRTLNLYDTRVTDAGMRYVGGLSSLETLYLNDTAVTDAGLQYLQGLTHLQELGLNNTRVTDAGLASLGQQSGLHTLTLGGSHITDTGLLQLRGLHNLHHLILNRTGVTAAGVQELKKSLPALEVSR